MHGSGSLFLEKDKHYLLVVMKENTSLTLSSSVFVSCDFQMTFEEFFEKNEMKIKCNGFGRIIIKPDEK